MDILKSMKDNYLLCSAIIFIILLILYALLYKKGKNKNNSDTKVKEESANKEKLIKYTFYFIFASLGTYALYLIYIKYVKNASKSMIGGGNQDFELASNVRISGEDVDIGFLD
jgi:quinol-cytochrome oxidoreductase complex cytochrome b subunit